MRHKRRVRNRIIISTIFVLIVIYLGMAVFFMGRYGFNTHINDIKADFMTVENMQELIRYATGNYELKIKGRNQVNDSITAADLALEPQFSGELEGVLKSQNPLLWPGNIFFPKEYKIGTVVYYPDERLERKLSNLNFFKWDNIVKPENAYISEESGENGFVIVPDKKGTTPKKDIIEKEIKEAVSTLKNELILSDNCYVNAEITADDSKLNSLIKNINEYCNVNIYYNFGNEKVDIDGNRVREWIDIDYDNNTVSINRAKIREFVDSVARAHDTFGQDRKIKSHSGEMVTIKGGDYGWWMDRPAETDGIIEALKNHEKGERTPVYRAMAASYGENDFGDSYVEIDLTSQHLWVYKDGREVADSDFVSGCVRKKNGTPVGSYAITYKERDAVLNGENYSSPVSYWMPFNGNVGMHDASWRSSFGGDIYLTSGSHGCINLPKKAAAKIFDLVEKGEAVLVYGGKEYVPPTAAPAPVMPEIPVLTPEQQLAILMQQQAAMQTQ